MLLFSLRPMGHTFITSIAFFPLNNAALKTESVLCWQSKSLEIRMNYEYETLRFSIIIPGKNNNLYIDLPIPEKKSKDNHAIIIPVLCAFRNKWISNFLIQQNQYGVNCRMSDLRRGTVNREACEKLARADELWIVKWVWGVTDTHNVFLITRNESTRQ